MKQKIKSFISLKATSVMFGLLFFVALAGGVVIDAPSASAATPVISGLTVTPNSGTVKIGSTVILTITADTTGHLESVITVNGVATTNFTDNSDNTYSVTYTVVEGNSDVSSGTITASVVLTDSGGMNSNTTAYTTVTVNTLVVDANSPTLISAELADDVLKIGETSLVTFTFSEAISDFTNDDLTIANGTLTAVTNTGAGTIWTATFTPTDDLEEAINVITVDMTGVADTATNDGVGSTDSSNYAIDTTAPVMISAVYKNNDGDADGIIDTVEVTYSEDIAVDSTFTVGEWSFPIDSNPHNLEVDSVTFSLTDVLITVINPENSETIDGTIVKYTPIPTSDTDGGIIDIAGNYAADGELPVRAEGYIDPPEDYLDGPATPNPNSGVTLYRLAGSPRVYVIKNKKRHWIQTPKEFNDAGYNWGKVKVVSAETLEEYSDEEEVSTTELLRAVGSHKVYKIENGKRRWIKTAGEFNAAGYKWKNIKDVSLETLTSYQNEVSSELLRATGDCKVYEIKDGKKSWIKTAREFNAAGHKWKDVEDVDAQDLDDYPNLD